MGPSPLARIGCVPSYAREHARSRGPLERSMRTARSYGFMAAVLLWLTLLGCPRAVLAQPPIESELVVQTPVSAFIVEAMLKEFSAYAKERWGVTLKTRAQRAGTPVSYE